MNLSKILKALCNTAYWPALVRGILPTVEHATILEGIEPLTIIDVGANKGQFSVFARHRWPKAKIFAFEPLPEQARKCRRVLGNSVDLRECALASSSGDVQIYLASRPDSSSLLPLGDAQKDIFSMDQVGAITVRSARLDQEINIQELVDPILLKIDVQGFEYEVLEGAKFILPRISFIYVELSFVELYKEQKTFVEVNKLLNDNGFSQITFANVLYGPDNNKIQADFLYGRTKDSYAII